MIKIQGKRIYLREYTADDLDDYHRLISNPVTRRLSIFDTTTSREETLLDLSEIIRQRESAQRSLYIFAVILKESKAYIGDAGFDVVKKSKNAGIAEIGYFLDKAYWGKGYATEIARILIDYCFTILKFHKVIAGCDARNTASEKVMQKCGMKKEGEFKKQRLKNGSWHDELKYGILKDEWNKRSFK
ncbi:MAG: GNAT family N-acetyltransferase [Spirochaetales bacterium]|nr:GNAT family N-acetyltransferase [Spirochaetales bacterium]